MRAIAAILFCLSLGLFSCSHLQRVRAPSLVFANYTRHAAHEAGPLLDTPVWVDASLSQMVRDLIPVVLGEWNVSLNGHRRFVRFGTVNEAGLSTIKSYILSDYPSVLFVGASFEDAEGTELGWVRSENISIVHVVDDLPSMSPSLMHQVLLHELGHTLGLQHMPGTLMNPSADNATNCVDETSARMIAALNGWLPESMNWCTL